MSSLTKLIFLVLKDLFYFLARILCWNCHN